MAIAVQLKMPGRRSTLTISKLADERDLGQPPSATAQLLALAR
jgi:hypothetical protein